MLDADFKIKIIDFATAMIKGKKFNKLTNEFENAEDFNEIVLSDKLTKIESDNNTIEKRDSGLLNFKITNILKEVNKDENKEKDENNKNNNPDNINNKSGSSNITNESNQFDDDNLSENNGENTNTKKKRRVTFCGTAEYVSPEMLQGEEIDYTADYWALGCIIYYLITSFSPFSDKSQYLIFQNIKNLSIDYDKVPNEAADLLNKIFVHEPKDRLGYYNISNIISHDFFITNDGFNSVDFILSESIPMKNTLITKSKIQAKNLELIRKSKNIEILKEQIVEKKSPYFHYNTRKLVLDSTPKVIYIDPSNNITKGVIILSKECVAEKVKNNYFHLHTPGRVFKFKLPDNSADEWAKLINEQIKNIAK